MECWETLYRLAVPPFPICGTSAYSPPLSHCQAQGAALLVGNPVGGRLLRTPDPPATLLPRSHPGDPRHRMRRGGGGQPLCPKGSRMLRGATPREEAHSTPQPSFSHMRASFRPQHIPTPPPNPRTARPQWPPDVTSHLTSL